MAQLPRNYAADSIEEAVALAERLREEGRYDLFRGQRENWPVVPTLARLNEEEVAAAKERLKLFFSWLQEQPELGALADHEDPAIVDQKYAIAQHYGLPTLFCDFTLEPRVAGFFASSRKGSEGGGTSVIVCCNSEDLISCCKQVFFPEVRLPEVLRIAVPNLWRLEAQADVFLFLSAPNQGCLLAGILTGFVYQINDIIKHRSSSIGCAGRPPKTLDIMLPAAAASAGDRDAGSRAVRLPAGSVPRRHDGARNRSPWPSPSAAPNSSARSTDNLSAVASGRGNRQFRARARPADAGGAPARETRTRGKPQNPAGPSVGSAPPAAAALAPVGHARDRQERDAPRRSVRRAGPARSGDAADSC
jgi:hypothetical protein